MKGMNKWVGCVIAAFGFSSIGQAATSPTPTTLGQSLFLCDGAYNLSAGGSEDRDHDGLRDALEFKLANYFRPYFRFDTAEKARRSNEPVVVFQVRPLECVGASCPLPIRVLIQYGYLFQRDGGYGPSSWCYNDHNGDSQSIDVRVESKDGRTWKAYRVNEGGTFDWPGTDIGWYQGHHPIAYLSAGKHHMFFSKDYDEEDSPFSDWGCNDDVNGNGSAVLAELASNYPPIPGGLIPHNVGEPEHHDSKYFLSTLDSFGFAGESIWGDKPFWGGLEDDGFGMKPLKTMWFENSFYLGAQCPINPDKAVIQGKIDAKGSPIPGVKLYYREACSQGAPPADSPCLGWWKTLPVSADGSYQAMLAAKNVLLRPVAAGYNFSNVPLLVKESPGKVLQQNFSALPSPQEGKCVPMLTQCPDEGSDPPTVNKHASLDSHAVQLSFPSRMAAFDPVAGNTEKDVDTILNLQRKAVVSVKLRSILSEAGEPAQSWEAAYEASWAAKTKKKKKCLKKPKILCSNENKPLGASKLGLKMGGSVKGAVIRMRLKREADLVSPQGHEWLTTMTDDNGEVSVVLAAGRHPGKLRVEIDVKKNPVNPWAVFSFSTHDIEVQPALSGDDAISSPLPKLEAFSSLLPAAGTAAMKFLLAGSFPPIAATHRHWERERSAQDLNRDGNLDWRDLDAFTKLVGLRKAQAGFVGGADLNRDGTIDASDKSLFEKMLKRVPK